jgi:phage tail tube protein FII
MVRYDPLVEFGRRQPLIGLEYSGHLEINLAELTGHGMDGNVSQDIVADDLNREQNISSFEVESISSMAGPCTVNGTVERSRSSGTSRTS